MKVLFSNASTRAEDLLDEKIHPDNIAERQKAGTTLSYLEAHHVVRELNRIFGPAGWSRQTIQNIKVDDRTFTGRSGEMREVSYVALVRITILREGHTDLVKEGTGAGSAARKTDGPQGDDLFGMAAKEAESDAMKRAAMQLGNVMGLALYDKQQRYVGETSRPIDESLVARVEACRSREELGVLFSSLDSPARAGAIDAFRARRTVLDTVAKATKAVEP